MSHANTMNVCRHEECEKAGKKGRKKVLMGKVEKHRFHESLFEYSFPKIHFFP